jgi:hypothetical protein
MQSQDSQVPTAPVKDAAPPVDGKTEPAPRKAPARKAKKATATPTAPPEAAPMTPAERAAKLQDFKAKLRQEIEPVLRAYQAEVAAINTDAAYDVKQTTDAYFMGSDAALNHFSNLLLNRPNYQPDTWRAEVVNGLREDIWTDPNDYAYKEAPTTPKPLVVHESGGRRINVEEIADEIVVDGEPVAARN